MEYKSAQSQNRHPDISLFGEMIDFLSSERQLKARGRPVEP